MTSIPTTTNGQGPQSAKKPCIGESEDDWDKGSITQTWYRLRASESWAYLSRLSTEDREKLMVDAQRIEKKRARLLKDATKKEYMPKLEHAFQEWRNEAFEKPGTKLKHPREDRGKPEGPEGNHFKQRLYNGFDVEEAIKNDDDPSHELKAGVMFFEECELGWKGVTHDKTSFSNHKEFPDQKILIHEALNGDKYNPFAPTFDDKGNRHLKYIHLPANHMGVSDISPVTSKS